MIRTGEQYRDSIRDNRLVYVNGERVGDLTTHPMFAPLVDIRARKTPAVRLSADDSRFVAANETDKESSEGGIVRNFQQCCWMWYPAVWAVDGVLFWRFVCVFSGDSSAQFFRLKDFGGETAFLIEG